MLSIGKILLLLVAVFALWFFYQGIRVRERALLAGRQYCRLQGVQFLDESVHRERLSLSRDSRGLWRVWRSYSFDYTHDGNSRRQGRIVTLGERIQHVELDGRLILH